ncbi:CBS domain-containing protein [Candidatus Woesearchaeota archaeon]|nr:CBS domain-containing protein [Candidatus Woesearchaeota archaeon]
MIISRLMSKNCDYVYGTDSVQKASYIMATHNRGLLAVLKSEEKKVVVGVLSNKDIIDKVVAKKKDTEKITVDKIMTRKYIYVNQNEVTSKVMFLMINNGIKRILVVDDEGNLIGIVASTDIIRAMLKYKKRLLDLALDF